MTESQWTVVWPEGDDPNNDDLNPDHYALFATRDEVAQCVQSLIENFTTSDGAEGAHPANILIFPPNTSLDATTFT